MPNLENTFVRGPSPSFSEEISENCMSTLPIGHSGSDSNFLPQKQHFVNANNFKGRNTFAFWVVITLLFVLTVGNLILTITIIGVLRLGKGMQAMETIPEHDSIKFYGNTDLDRILNKCGGRIDGFADEPMSLTAEDNAVNVKIHRNGQLHSKMTIDQSGIAFKGVNTFELKDPTSGDTIFSTHRPHYAIPEAGNLQAKIASVGRISSPIGHPLTFESDNKITVRGSEGIGMEGQSIIAILHDKISLNSSQGSLYMDNGDGIFLDMDKIPKMNSESGLRQDKLQYKLCICMPQGKLFRIPIIRMHAIKITCAHFSPKHNPCE